MYQPKTGKLLCDGKPVYQSLKMGKKFKLDQWWAYEDHRQQVWVIPPGFEYDLASVPSWMAGSLQWGFWNVGAVPHDWAYEYGYLLRVENGKLRKVSVTKLKADNVFADVMFSVGRKYQADIMFWRGLKPKPVQFWRMRLIYGAVRLFGRGVWFRDRMQPLPPALSELQRMYDQVQETTEPENQQHHLYVV